MSFFKDKFVDGDRTIEVTVGHDGDAEGKRKTGRAYLRNWTDDLSVDDVLVGFKKALGLTTAYTTRGEYPAMDKAWDAYNSIIINAKTEDMKLVLSRLIESVPELKGAEPKFNRFAGCACGCSPGFTLMGVPASLVMNVTVTKGVLA